DVTLGTRLPIAGDRAVDDPGIDPGDRLVVEAEPRHHAWAELLDQHVRARDQRIEPRPFDRILEVERDALLAAIEPREACALAAPFRPMRAHLLAAPGRLDLHHLGAGFGEQKRGQRPRQQGREVEHEQALERSHALSYPVDVRPSPTRAGYRASGPASRPACRAAWQARG